jgi:hypothetical protein
VLRAVIDDRHRDVNLHARAYALAAKDAASALRRPDRFASASLRPRHAGPILLALGTLALLAIIVLLFLYEGVVGLWLMLFSGFYTQMIIVVGLAAGGGAVALKHLKVRAARAMLRRKHCPACNFDLAHSPPQPDGCTVCGECGAAWAARRLGLDREPPPEVVVVRSAAPLPPPAAPNP